MRGAEKRVCAADGCDKTVHLMCYQGVVLVDKKNNNHSSLPPLPGNHVACTKACYNAATKALSGNTGRGNWTSDGKGGTDDPHTSMKILLDWMTTEGNYSRFCGKDNNGVKKQQFANSLAEKMREETCSETRNAKQVLDKISRIETSFREAYEFANSVTGAGIQDEQGEESFKDLVRKKCPYYYELVDIMADRASTEPRITNYRPSDLDSDEVEEEEGDYDNYDDDEQQEGTPDSIRTPAQQEVRIRNMAKVSRNNESTANSVASSRNSNKKPRRGSASKNPLMDDDTVKMLGVANETSKEKMEELKRHNKQVETIEMERLDLEKKKYEETKWKGKSDKLDYKMKLISDYNTLKEKGMADDRIARFFPEMKGVIAAFNGEDLSSSSSADEQD